MAVVLADRVFGWCLWTEYDWCLWTEGMIGICGQKMSVDKLSDWCLRTERAWNVRGLCAGFPCWAAYI